MTNRNKPLFIVSISLLFFSIMGCVSKPAIENNITDSRQSSNSYLHAIQPEIFQPINLDQKYHSLLAIQKTNKLIILVDESVSPHPSNDTNININSLNNSPHNNTLKNFISTLPKDIRFTQTIETFGLQYKNQGNLSSLASVLSYYLDNLNLTNTNTAIVIFSNWKQIDTQSILKAEQLFIQYGHQLCIHMIGMGNIHQNNRLIKTQHCGNTASAESLQTSKQMANFVENIFISELKDSDLDGIYDYQDQCPNTPFNSIITWNGCLRNSKKSNQRYIIL